MRIKALLVMILMDVADYEFIKFACREHMLDEVDCMLMRLVELKDFLMSEIKDRPDNSKIIPIKRKDD